jgi:hypothetical protein
MFTVTAVRLLPHFGQATESMASRGPAMSSFSVADTLDSPLGPLTPHLQGSTELDGVQCKIRSRTRMKRLRHFPQPEGSRQGHLDTVLDRRHDLARAHRFAQHTGWVQVVEGRVAVGEDDDRQTLVAGVSGNLLANRRAVDIGQDNVQDNGIERVAVENRQRLDAVPCFTRCETVERQGNRQQPPEVVIVFDEEDRLGGWHRARLLAATTWFL